MIFGRIEEMEKRCERPHNILEMIKDNLKDKQDVNDKIIKSLNDLKIGLNKYQVKVIDNIICDLENY